MNIESITARKLLQMKAFYVQVAHPFKWSNGWKAPIYLDDRKILSFAQARAFIKLELSRIVAEHFPDIDLIAGVATSAIAHGVLVAEQLGLPFVYVYPTPKDHGMENQIEGELRPRQKVVIIENQVNMGMNLANVIEAIRNNGCMVEGVITIFDYQFPAAQKRLSVAGVPLLSLTNFETILAQAEQDNIYSTEDIAILKEWHRTPTKWKAVCQNLNTKVK